MAFEKVGARKKGEGSGKLYPVKTRLLGKVYPQRGTFEKGSAHTTGSAQQQRQKRGKKKQVGSSRRSKQSMLTPAETKSKVKKHRSRTHCTSTKIRSNGKGNASGEGEVHRRTVLYCTVLYSDRKEIQVHAGTGTPLFTLPSHLYALPCSFRICFHVCFLVHVHVRFLVQVQVQVHVHTRHGRLPSSQARRRLMPPFHSG